MPDRAYIIVDGQRIDVDMSEIRWEYECDSCAQQISQDDMVTGSVTVQLQDGTTVTRGMRSHVAHVYSSMTAVYNSIMHPVPS